MMTAISNWWSTIPKPTAGALAVWAIVIVLTSFFVTLLLAGDLYAKREFSQVILYAALLSLLPTMAQIYRWYQAQPQSQCWLTAIWKAPQEILVGIAMHYPAILIGISLGGLTSQENCTRNCLDLGHITLVMVQQAALTGATWIIFRERLRKRIPPGQSNQPAGQPNQPARARKEDKQIAVVQILLALLAIVQVLLALLAVVTALTVFVGAKKGNRRRRK